MPSIEEIEAQAAPTSGWLAELESLVAGSGLDPLSNNAHAIAAPIILLAKILGEIQRSNALIGAHIAMAAHIGGVQTVAVDPGTPEGSPPAEADGTPDETGVDGPKRGRPRKTDDDENAQ